MKKLFLTTLVAVTIMSTVFIACEKTDDTPAPTTINCKDSAWLLPDSLGLACAGKNVFQLIGRNKTLIVATGLYPAIDAVTNGGFYYITYDSLNTTTACMGALFTNATLSCYQKK